MAVIYSFEKFKLRKRIKELQEILREKEHFRSPFGFLGVDHYYTANIHKEILSLTEQLAALDKDVDNDSGSTKN